MRIWKSVESNLYKEIYCICEQVVISCFLVSVVIVWLYTWRACVSGVWLYFRVQRVLWVGMCCRVWWCPLDVHVGHMFFFILYFCILLLWWSFMHTIFCSSLPWNLFMDFQKCNSSVSRLMFGIISFHVSDCIELFDL